MGPQLFAWMRKQQGNAAWSAQRYSKTVQYFEENFPSLNNIEDILTKLDEQTDEADRVDSPAIKLLDINEALRAWFAEIRQEDRALAL